MLGIVRMTESDSGLRRVLVAVKVLEKFRWLQPLVCPMDWKLVDAVATFHDKRRGTTSKYWASMRAFGSLCRLASQPDEWEVVALAALSIACGLRAKEAVTAFYDGAAVHWQGAKGRRGACKEVPGSWRAHWARLLWDIRARHGYHPKRPAWHPIQAKPAQGPQRPRQPPKLGLLVAAMARLEALRECPTAMLGCSDGHAATLGGPGNAGDPMRSAYPTH